jgi:putative transcription factor
LFRTALLYLSGQKHPNIMPNVQHTSGQDWKPQVFHFAAKPATGAAAKPVARAPGDIERRSTANAHTAGLGAMAKRIDDDTESTRVKTVDFGVRINLQKARQAKNLTQADLARLICERASVVTDYENGKAVPNEQILVRMEKALGVHLRGVKAGQPMEAKIPKAAAAAAARS